MTSDTDPRPAESSAATVVIVLTTLPADADAEAFARALVNERLAACVSVGAEMTLGLPRGRARSSARGSASSCVKTRAGARSRSSRPGSRRFIRTTFPSCSCCAVADGGEAYLAWVRESTAALSYHPCEAHDTDRDVRARRFRSRSAGG